MKKMIIASLALISTSAVLAQPLATQSVRQYECLINNSVGLLGYFIPRMPPAPIPYSNEPVIVCHDTQYGRNDGPGIPRRNEKNASFKVWDGANPLFYDNDGDGNLDVDNLIVRTTRNYGGIISSSSDFFKKVIVRGHDLGYLMSYFVDQTTFRSYCPSNIHYNGLNPLFKALRDVIAVDTEGLYVGQRMRGDRDLIYVSETFLKKSWFHIINNRPVVPTEQSVANAVVYFASEGDIFQIKELNLPGRSTNYPSHDRKIGCVPKM